MDIAALEAKVNIEASCDRLARIIKDWPKKPSEQFVRGYFWGIGLPDKHIDSAVNYAKQEGLVQ